MNLRVQVFEFVIIKFAFNALPVAGDRSMGPKQVPDMRPDRTFDRMVILTMSG